MCFFSPDSMKSAVTHLNKWMSSRKQSQVFLCSWCSEYSGFQGTAKLTHIFIPQQTKTHVNGIRSSWVSWQSPGLSSTVICSCKCSTGPSGKPCPKNGCVLDQLPDPQWIKCLCENFWIQIPKISYPVRLRPLITDASQLGCILCVFILTRTPTHSELEIFIW